MRAESLDVHVGGRVESLGSNFYRFGWPANYFVFSGVGEAFSFDLRDRHGMYSIYVDDKLFKIIENPKGRETVNGLLPNVHTVTIEKNSESAHHDGSLCCIRIRSPLVHKKLLVTQNVIQFIGDSFTVGYGNLNKKKSRRCSKEDVYKNTDTQKSYAVILSKNINFDYDIIAFSGIGMVRNYADVHPELNIRTLYDRSSPSGSNLYQQKSSDPDIIVINVGTNDFSKPVNSSKIEYELISKKYISSYIAFVQYINFIHPKSHIILVSTQTFQKEIQTISGNLSKYNNIETFVFNFPKISYAGCNMHPSTEDDVIIAEKLREFIRYHNWLR